MGPEPAAASGGNRQAERRESQGAGRARDFARSPGRSSVDGNGRESRTLPDSKKKSALQTDELRFYKHMRMFSLKDGRKQLAVYQRESNNHIMTCLGMRSPNQVLELYHGVMW